MQNTYIIGSGCYLPGNPIDNETLSQLLHLNKEWIDHFVGTKTRHFALDFSTGKSTMDLAELCYEASLHAIKDAGINPQDIDAIVLATATPDYLMPTSVNLLADQLGIHNLPTYQLQSGCSGAVQALDFACQLIQGKGLKNILVVGADTCTKFLDVTQDFTKLSRKELINYILFGDGAGAIILSSESSRQALAIQNIINQFVGKNKKPGQIIQWFGNKKQLDTFDKEIIAEDYKEIESAVPMMTQSVLSQFEVAGCDMSDISYLLPPQLSKHMTEKIIQQLNLPPSIQYINCVEDTGNNGNALAFMQIDQLRKSILPGQKALLIAIESSKWIQSGVSFYAN